jgi:hypothetical protein
LPDSLIAQLAEEHARVYDKTGACFFAQTTTGVYKFYTSEEIYRHANKHGGKGMVATIGKLHNVAKSKRGGARKTEAKPEWQKLGDAFSSSTSLRSTAS